MHLIDNQGSGRENRFCERVRVICSTQESNQSKVSRNLFRTRVNQLIYVYIY